MKKTNLTIVQGTPFRFKVVVQTRNLDGLLVQMDLTGCVIKLQARARIQDSTALLDLSSTTNNIVVDLVAGSFILNMSSVETAALVWAKPNFESKAVYQCEIHPPNGETIRILDGTLTLDPEVVR